MKWQAGSIAMAAWLAGCTLPGPQPAPPLRGTTWLVAPVQAPEMSPPRPAELLLDATSDRYTGFTGCNRLGGSFVLAGSTLRLGAGAATRMACADPAGAEEARVLQALPRVQGWQQAGSELQLLDANGQPVLLLRARPAPR